MKAQTKNVLKIAAVVIIAGALGFYISKIRGGGREAASFVSLNYSWGVGDTLQNFYDSQSGDYQFVNQRDSLIKENFRLRINNIIYLYSKMREGDLLSIPDTVANSAEDLNNKELLRYEFDFVYDDTTRKIVYISNYDKDPEIAQKASGLQKLVEQIVLEAEDRYLSK
jgi:hypothetical protein